MKNSFVAMAVLLCAVTAPALAASPPVEAMETSIFLGGGLMHDQYHENITPGDEESGLTSELAAGGHVLVPAGGARAFDYYASLGYNYNPGSLAYNGHDMAGNPLRATDEATFNRVEARLGIGMALPGGSEVIPFLAGGYQQWNRVVQVNGSIGASETYRTALFGGGAKLDVPLTRNVVASGSAEILALAGGSITSNLPGIVISPGNFGVTPEERVELGLDDALVGPLHIYAQAYFTHFTYSGTHPDATSQYYEPSSETLQEGINLGFGYSFR
jgi:hypothetical protein